MAIQITIESDQQEVTRKEILEALGNELSKIIVLAVIDSIQKNGDTREMLNVVCVGLLNSIFTVTEDVIPILRELGIINENDPLIKEGNFVRKCIELIYKEGIDLINSVDAQKQQNQGNPK